MTTRDKIVEAVFYDIQKKGFQGTRADKAVQPLGITKGALYHYFPDKHAIGYSVVDEILAPRYVNNWKMLASYPGHPVDGIKASINALKNHYTDDTMRLGCPLNNLIQEMSPIDEGFRKRLQHIVDTMQQDIADSLRTGQVAGTIRADIDADEVAFFILATVEGSYSMAKVKQSKSVFFSILSHLETFLDTLRFT